MSLGLRTARIAALRGLARPLSNGAIPARPLARAYTPSAAPSRPLVRQRLPRFQFRRPNSTHPNPHTAHEAAKEPPKTAYARFKELTKTYGSYAVIMYLAISAVDFSVAFAIVHGVGVERIEPYTRQMVRWYRELRHGKAGAEALEKADEARKLADEAEDAADEAISGKHGESWWWNKALWAEIALAYSIHKVGFMPVRAGLTVAWTPKVVHWLRARGWIGSSGAKRAMQHGQTRVRGAMQQAKEKAKDVID